MTERTVKDVMHDLIRKADIAHLGDTIRGDLPSRNHPKRDDYNSQQVGKLVTELPEEDRKILENMTSKDMEEFEWFFGGYTRMRPKERTRDRVRGPVKLSK